ncbi:hypothetical protein ACXEI5_002241 [Klebsiella quasipneumoniae]
MNDPDFNLLAALDPLPVSTGVITVWQAWHPRLEQVPDHRWLRQRVREVCRE